MKASFFVEEEGDLEPGKFMCNVIILFCLWSFRYTINCIRNIFF
jgi:hypothetical protein